MTAMKRYLFAFALWTLVALLFSGQLAMDAAYAGRRIERIDAIVLAFTGWYAWALLSPLVAWLARRFGPNVRGLAVHAAASVVLTMLKMAGVTAILRAFDVPMRSISMLVNIPVNLAAYWLIAGIVWALQANLRSAKLEASLASARLDLLRTQLQPHFLFNTLHGIAELMHEDVEAADKMVARLSDLLRATLDTGGRQEITLRDELALLDRYIDIQRMRLGERLRFTADVDARALDRAVPMLLLQPLVENSVRHAIASRRDGGNIAVRARENRHRLTIEIEDDGPGFEDECGAGFSPSADGLKPIPHRGIGIANVRDRLQHLYGTEQTLKIGTAAGGGGLVRIEIPLKEHGPDPHDHR
jgi:signal transduction histidine kinase